jgi:hypothetical protein
LDKAKLYIRQYFASDGVEFFISIEVPKTTDPDDTYLLGLLRLRLSMNEIRRMKGENVQQNHYFKEFKRDFIAKIREVHVYGFIQNRTATNDKAQHHGIGKFMISVAELIAYFYGFNKMAIISGVGVRNYYKKTGYLYDPTTDGEFMMKDLYDFKNEILFSPLKLFGRTYDRMDILGYIQNMKLDNSHLIKRFNVGISKCILHQYKNIPRASMIIIKPDMKYKWEIMYYGALIGTIIFMIIIGYILI